MLITTCALIIISLDFGNVFGTVPRINKNSGTNIEEEIDCSHWNALPSLLTGIANYHGYVSIPPSRAVLCQLRVNQNCGRIMYEPQSVEGYKGFPYSFRSPADGKIASGGNSNFEKLNEYGKDRWITVAFPQVHCFNKTHLYFNLTWTLTAPHRTDSIRVFVSNENYTPTEPLARHHLDLTPICSIKFYGKIPPTVLSLQCPISREKYQQLHQLNNLLLLSVWDIQDTSNAFYQVADLERLPVNETYENIRQKCSKHFI